MPLFSIIVVHYQGTIPHDTFLRGIGSLQNQTFKDFEILCYHDGPLLNGSVQFPVPVTCTAVRFNDWGHSLRDQGIREATGDYIVHFNADNVLYPQALETIAAEIARPPRIFYETSKLPADTNDIIIFPITMRGYQEFRNMRVCIRDADFYILLTGIPPIRSHIDCLQLVMKRELWVKEGGWRVKIFDGDSIMYEAFCEKYGYRNVGPVLADHY
ncbi:MAG: glycosyltransferase [Tepidisphaeraceae bacterium]